MTWERPAEYQAFLDAASTITADRTVVNDAWTACRSDDGNFYYVNERTRFVSWERPDGFVDVKKTTASKPIKSKATNKSTKADNKANKLLTKRRKNPFDTVDDLEQE